MGYSQSSAKMRTQQTQSHRTNAAPVQDCGTSATMPYSPSDVHSTQLTRPLSVLLLLTSSSTTDSESEGAFSALHQTVLCDTAQCGPEIFKTSYTPPGWKERGRMTAMQMCVCSGIALMACRLRLTSCASSSIEGLNIRIASSPAPVAIRLFTLQTRPFHSLTRRPRERPPTGPKKLYACTHIFTQEENGYAN